MTDVPSNGALTKLVGPPSGATVRLMFVFCDTPPPEPLTVSVECPNGVVEPTVIDSVELPEPGAAIDVGLNVTIAPVGGVLAESAMSELSPPAAAVEIVVLAVPPCGTVNVVGEAVSARLPGAGLKIMSKIGCISMLFGARPV